jgi:hypothetical protein
MPKRKSIRDDFYGSVVDPLDCWDVGVGQPRVHCDPGASFSAPLVFPEAEHNLHETQEVESYGMYTARVL